MTDPTERALALASEALHAIRADLVRCEGESGSCHATLERAEGGDWIAVTEAVPAVARVIQGVLDEAGALQRELEHERQRLAAVGVLAHSRNEAQLAGMLPEYESDALAGVRLLLRNLLDAIEDTP